MGLRLRRTFVDAGLPTPRLEVQARVEGGPDSPFYGYITQSLRSMLPLAKGLSAGAPQVADIDDLEKQLRGEIVAGGGVLMSPLLVGASSSLAEPNEAEELELRKHGQ